MGLDAGQVFIHRNVANVIPNTDLNAMSVIEYAVVRLRVKHVIVCGHYDCGGVQAALESHDMELLNPWLRNIRDVYRLHEAELDNIKDERLKNRRLVELNVLEQARNVIKTAAVQKSYYEYGYPEVHALVFDLANGELTDLKVGLQNSPIQLLNCLVISKDNVLSCKSTNIPPSAANANSSLHSSWTSRLR